MRYASVSEFLTRYSAEEIAQRADRNIPRLVTAEMLREAVAGGNFAEYTPEEEAATLAAVYLIEQALRDADSEIDAYVSTRYRTPLNPVPEVVQRYACDLARYNLYDDQVTEVIEKRRDATIRVLRDLASGKVSLGTTESGNVAAPAHGLVEMAGPKHAFGRRPNGGLL
jgi:phage gp36-like protein